MDFNMKQWRNQQYESGEQHHSAKIPKLHSNTNPHETQHQKPELPSEPALPLFVPEQRQSPNKLTNHLSPTQPFPHQSTPSSRPSRMGSGGGGYFSLAQWQELELQALIFRYMVAGAAVPAELLQPIRKSLSNLLINTPHYFLQHPLQPYYPHYQQPALFGTGYWGRAAMDPEPGRCRRTDGKKWRCSRDVVVGHKYCERHMHRGRNRSRKPVETPTLAGKHAGAGNSPHSPSSSALAAAGGGTHFALAGKMPSDNNTSAIAAATTTSIDLLFLARSSSDVKCENKHALEPSVNVSGEAKSDGHVLRHFFDDWPRLRQEPKDAVTATSERNSAASLSISMVGNSSSDVLLKLSTGDGPVGDVGARAHSERQQMGWAAGWGSNPMGGPLAEALRSSSNSNSSPTSVLHQLPRGSAPETCIVSS